MRMHVQRARGVQHRYSPVVAQTAERLPCKQRVLGSIPSAGTTSPGDTLDATDWLDQAPVSTAADGSETSPSAVAVEGDWLETGSQFATPYAAVRFMCMRGSGRVWACDGEYVACRPGGFHEGTRERHQRFLASGHYKHVGTFDDVQVFELLPGSPFRRDNRTLIPGVNLYQDIRECAIAAVNRDWVLYHDILEAIAENVKARFSGEAANEFWGDVLSSIFQSIARRGGPTQAEVDAGLNRVRMARGLGKGRVIAIPNRVR